LYSGVPTGTQDVLLFLFPHSLQESSRDNSPVRRRAHPSKCSPVHHYHSSWTVVFETANVIRTEERKELKKLENET